MNEIRPRLHELARSRSHRLDDRAAARYLAWFAGHRSRDVLHAIDVTARDCSHFPTPGEILRRLPPRGQPAGPDDPPPATAAERAQVRQLATRYLARYGLEPAPLVEDSRQWT